MKKTATIFIFALLCEVTFATPTIEAVVRGNLDNGSKDKVFQAVERVTEFLKDYSWPEKIKLELAASDIDSGLLQDTQVINLRVLNPETGDINIGTVYHETAHLAFYYNIFRADGISYWDYLAGLTEKARRYREIGVYLHQLDDGPLRAYNELWADIIAVVLTGDSAVMYKEAYPIPMVKNDPMKAFHTSQRDFSRPYFFRLKEISGLKSYDPYTALDATRYYIWRHYVSKAKFEPKPFVDAVLQAFQAEVSHWMKMSPKYDYSELNERLIKAINKNMGQENDSLHIELKEEVLTSHIDNFSEQYPELLKEALRRLH